MEPAERIALRRVHALFRLAREVIREDPQLAQRYVETARRVAMRTRMRLPAEYRRQVCRHCKRFILPGVNCRVRTREGREPHVAVTCLECGRETRIPLRRRADR